MSKASEQQKSDFSSEEALLAAAHELKTPLTIISHLVSTLRDDSIGLSQLQQECYLERIELTSERMMRLVEGLTQSYRFEQAGEVLHQLELEPLNLTQICEDVVHELTPLASHLGQNVQLRLPLKNRLVVGHKELLQNIITNLVDNALKHNPKDTDVILTMNSQDQLSRLNVRDNGPMIAAAEFKQLKQRLGKQVQTTAYRAGSSGLGLYIAGQLAKAMGGNLGATAHRQGGMTLYVDLLRSRQLSFL